MLPFEHRPWAKPLAILVIIAAVLVDVAVALWRSSHGPIHFVDLLAMALFLLAIVPPNIHILRLKTSPEDFKPDLKHSAAAARR